MTCPVPTVRQALQAAIERLKSQGLETPRLEAEVLLAHLLGCTRTELVTRWHLPLSPDLAAAFDHLVARRLQREPAAYLIGERAFYDVTLAVDPRVLIPRPETEQLVELALAWAGAMANEDLRVVDVGTGSGALAVVLARKLPSAQVTAIDVSADALAVAASNLARYGLTQRVCLLQGELLAPLQGRPADLIVANLPYVPHEDLPELMADVRDYEPHLALDGGPAGVVLIERLIDQAAKLLAPPGLLLLEIDPRQVDTLLPRARMAFPQGAVSVHVDFAGHARVLRIERRPDA
jgi:release factor glutamine methyltransferase